MKLMPGMESIKNPIAEIFKYLESDLKKIDDIIYQNCKGEAELIHEIASHIISSGGKRIRPILTVLSAQICGFSNKENHHYNLAAAVELIHTATLLHDDVVDEGLLRRGKDSANVIWGNKASILVGDYLLSTAFQLMVKSNSLPVLDLLSNTSQIMSDGEVMQLMKSTDIDIKKDIYLKIISQKTAILFSAATSVGAIISSTGHDKEKALYDYGENLGIAFQIRDDVLDYSSSKETLGKEIGDDFFEGKITLPVILAYEKSTDYEKARLKEIFNENMMNEDKDESLLSEVMNLMQKYDSLEESNSYALLYHKKAVDSLSVFKDSKQKDMLISIVDYAAKRKK